MNLQPSPSTKKSKDVIANLSRLRQLAREEQHIRKPLLHPTPPPRRDAATDLFSGTIRRLPLHRQPVITFSSEEPQEKGSSKIDTHAMEEALTYGKFSLALKDRKFKRRTNTEIFYVILYHLLFRQRRTARLTHENCWEIRINRNDAKPRANLHFPFSIKRTTVSKRTILCCFYQNWLRWSVFTLCFIVFPVTPPLFPHLLLHLRVLSSFLFSLLSVVFQLSHVKAFRG